MQKLTQYNEHFVNTLGTDGLVLKHQGNSGYTVEYEW